MSSLSHGLTFCKRGASHTAHLLIQAAGISGSAQQACFPILHGFPTAGNVAGNDWTANGGGFQQHIAHALVVAGKHHAVSSSIVGKRIGLETVVDCNTPCNQALYLTFVRFIVIKSNQVQNDGAARSMAAKSSSMPFSFIRRPRYRKCIT